MISKSVPCIIAIVLTFIGAIMGIFVLTSFFRYHWGNLKSKVKAGSLMVMVFSTGWPSIMFAKYLTIAIKGYLLQGWRQYDGITVTIGAGGTLAGYMFLALERYYQVIKSKPPTLMVILTASLCMYSYILMAVILQVFVTEKGYTEMESGIWCFFDFTLTTFIERFISTMVLVYCIGSVAITSSLYFSVYWKTRQVSRQLKQSVETKSQAVVTATRWNNIERRVFYRCLLLSGSFTTFFTPVFLSFLYRTFSGQYIAPGLDFFIVLWAHLDSIATPILVCYMNYDFRVAVMAYLPLAWSQRIAKALEAEAAMMQQNQSITTSGLISVSAKSQVVESSIPGTKTTDLY